jgi:hypothetical protein
MQNYQPSLIKSISQYILGLRQLGVVDPLFVGISLLGMAGCLLIPLVGHTYGFGNTPCQEDHMILDTVRIDGGDVNSLTYDSVTELLRRPLRQMWRYCGYARAPKFSHDCVFQDFED